ncbi:MAG: general secretion pathway protein GspK [Alphaproteobacteria bacterium]|nr:general secretion pathway protein GspK [Alphaproteobacteria bacterium]
MRGPGRTERGVALIAALWVLALLSALLVGFAGTTRTETVLARNLLDLAHARHLADGAIQMTALRLIGTGAASRLRVDGVPFETNVDGFPVRVQVFDEGGRIDLNAAPEELLASLFIAVGAPAGEARALARNITDWREEAEDGGRLARLYAAAGHPGAPRARPFAHVGELAHILGMRAEWLERARPLVTVLNGQDGVDPASAPVEVLAALPGLDPRTARSIVERRPPAFHRQQLGDPDLGPAEIHARPSRGVGFLVRAELVLAPGRIFRREAQVVLLGAGREPFRIVDLR